MGIDKIGPINNYNNINKVNKKTSVDKVNSSDSVNISTEALNKAEKNRIMEILNNTPDIREDKVKEVKAKLENPNYINEVIAKSLADKIMDFLEI